MGQYWKVVNLDKREWVDPHQLGVGMKLGEQVGSGHGTPDAIFILVTALREHRGGGDFDWDTNYYGPERDNKIAEHRHNGGPVIEAYNEIAKRTIGRWAGDRIAVVGDYADDSDLEWSITTDKGTFGFASIYGMCQDHDDTENIASAMEEYGVVFKDVTPDVARVIEHEVGGRFIGDGWRKFVRHGSDVMRWTGQHDSRVRQKGKVMALTEDKIDIQWDGEKKPNSYSCAKPEESFWTC